MNIVSVRSLLLAHATMFAAFCAIATIGYSLILLVLRISSGNDIAEIHQHLRSVTSFQDTFAAAVMALSAIVAGWVAAKTAKTRPLLHGAFSAIGFFLLFSYWTFHDVFDIPQNVGYRLESLSKIAQLLVPLFGIAGAYIATLPRDTNVPESSIGAG